jgi:subtilase family protein
MKYRHFLTKLSSAWAATFFGVSLGSFQGIAAGASANFDNEIRRIIEHTQSGGILASGTPKVSTTAEQLGLASQAIQDSQQRILVNVHLNGNAPMTDVRTSINNMGGKVAAENASYRSGISSAYVPANKLTDLAGAPGVLSLAMVHKPYVNAGLTTSGGCFAIRSDVLNGQGINGNGLTVGALSDSYNTATTDLFGNPLTIHEAQDVATDDLPGTGNPNGNTSPVVVLEDIPFGGFDEGRAMLQIVHDVAPKAHLAFATAFVSDVDFANNIRLLRTSANCDVIVDDVFYTNEPFFEDGIIAQAVDDVAFSNTLPGKKCLYFSSAGNQQGGGWTSTFTNSVPNQTGRLLPGQNIKWSQVPQNLTSGGFVNFNPDPNGPIDISQSFSVFGFFGIEIIFQWNDPFDKPNGVTTDYNILVFDVAGNYLPQFSGTSNNFSTQEPIEDIAIINNSSANKTFQIVIARSGTSPATPVARALRYLAIGFDGNAAGASEYYQPLAPATFGHNCAQGAFGTAAYVYDDNPSNPPAPPFTPAVETFTSQGPDTKYFDASGNRLAVAQVRSKPDIAAPDGGNTTFFGFDYEGDGFPNFFGTSAAAPHAAGVAALLLQKAGGPNSLTMNQVKNDLEASPAFPHDLDPFQSACKLQSRRLTVLLSAVGNDTNSSSADKNFFTLNFFPGTTGETLESIQITLTGAGLKFDSTTKTGYPFTLGKLVNISPDNIHNDVPPQNSNIPSITMTFDPGTFKIGTAISFGIDRDFIGDGDGNSADFLPGASVTAVTTRSTLNGTFFNTFGFGYTIEDGFGFIDAVNAAGFIP